MTNIDPAKMRALAVELRAHAATLNGVAPIAKPSRDAARSQMTNSDLAVKIEESLKAMDRVVQYHASRQTWFADELDRQAVAFEGADQGFAADVGDAGKDIEQTGPR
ncbi:hypothetical protein IU448_19040 [Nocardia flavorosea]|uniref:hypothetical protein n=1 Tax=Nocardia flavorosea TaxID=53429 RepID=UPI001893B8C1|nr:hypothetical protein [Nocardia flavorosea]MBF6351095.1 hypothetical protein [Nocardia flavorosea]